MLQFILRKGLWEIGFLGRSSTSDIKTVTTTMIATPKDNQSLTFICKGSFAQWPVCSGWSFCAGENRVASEAAPLGSLGAICGHFRCTSWKQVQHLSRVPKRNYPGNASFGCDDDVTIIIMMIMLAIKCQLNTWNWILHLPWILPLESRPNYKRQFMGNLDDLM